MADTQLDLEPTPDDEVGNVLAAAAALRDASLSDEQKREIVAKVSGATPKIEERVIVLEGVIGELKRRLDLLEEPDLGGPIRDEEPDLGGPKGQS